MLRVKLLDLKLASNETNAYGATIIGFCYPTVGQLPNLMLGLAGTPTCYQLKLFTPCTKHIHHIEIAKAGVANKYECKSLLAVMYVGCHALIKNPIVEATSCTLKVCCSGKHKQLHNSVWDRNGDVIRHAFVVHCETTCGSTTAVNHSMIRCVMMR